MAVSGNESAQRSAADDREGQKALEDGKSLAPLMQVEHVDDIPIPQNSQDDTEQAAE